MIGARQNALMLAAGAAPLTGETVNLVAGSPCIVGDDAVWFPTTAVLRSEIGRSGLFGGWEDYHGAVGLRSPSKLRWRTQTAGAVFVAQRVQVSALLARTPAFSEAVLDWSLRSCEEALRLAAVSIEFSGLQRVALLISELAVLHGPDEPFAVSQAELALMTGLQRTTVCGAMVQLRSQSLIRYSRSRVTVVDLHRLQALTDGSAGNGLLDETPSARQRTLASAEPFRPRGVQVGRAPPQ